MYIVGIGATALIIFTGTLIRSSPMPSTLDTSVRLALDTVSTNGRHSQTAFLNSSRLSSSAFFSVREKQKLYETQLHRVAIYSRKPELSLVYGLVPKECFWDTSMSRFTKQIKINKYSIEIQYFYQNLTLLLKIRILFIHTFY